jgi:hypothetical protein
MRGFKRARKKRLGLEDPACTLNETRPETLHAHAGSHPSLATTS